MAFLPAPDPADFSLTIGTPIVSWNVGNDSVNIVYRGAGFSAHGIGLTLPATPWRIDFEGLIGPGNTQAASHTYPGLFFRRSSTGRAVSWSMHGQPNGSNGPSVINWTNLTGTLSTTQFAADGFARWRFWRVDCDGTNLTFYGSDDWDGIGYIQMHTEALATWLGAVPDQVYVADTGESVAVTGTQWINMVGWRVS